MQSHSRGSGPPEDSPRQRLLDSAEAVLDRLLVLLSDLQFRQELRELAVAFLDCVPPPAADASPAGGAATSRSNAGPAAVAAAGNAANREAADPVTVSEGAGIVEDPGLQPVPADEAARLLQQRFGRGFSRPLEEEFRSGPPRAEPAAFQDAGPLALIEKRCRLKAEACNWAAQRRRLAEQSGGLAAASQSRDREFESRAAQIDGCHLWMTGSRSPEPDDVADFERLGECFEALANASSLVRMALLSEQVDDPELNEAVFLMAEAQSMVRAMASEIGHTQDDDDQLEAFRWLRRFTKENNVYVDRYMRRDDNPDPRGVRDLLQRIQEFDGGLTGRIQREKSRRDLWGKIRYHARQVQNKRDDFHNDARTLLAAIDRLVAEGVRPSDVDLRELLIPVVDHLEAMEDIPSRVVQVLREIDRYRSRNPATTGTAPGPDWSVEVAEVEALLQGKSVFLVGGEQRPLQKARIEQAFGLAELIWETTVEHSSNDPFLPVIERPDVALVLLAIRWSSHSYGEIDEYCKRFGKPLVRLPGGMHPNQIAHQILQQASERL